MNAKLILRYVKFATSSLGGTVVDTIVLWIFAHLVFKGWYVGENIISPTISFECAVVTNYTLAYFFVWKDRVLERSMHNFLVRFFPYNVSCITAFLIKMAILLVVQHLTQLDVVICNLIALLFSGCWNFAMNEWLIFRRKK